MAGVFQAPLPTVLATTFAEPGSVAPSADVSGHFFLLVVHPVNALFRDV